MKNGGPNHPKTIQLADLLGLERWGAVGIVETLIHWCRQYAIQGNIGKWSNKAIADGIGWKGDPDKLIQSLVLATFLDEHEDAEIRLIVHDIEKHADNTWKQNLEDAGLKWWNGKKPRNAKVGRPKGLTSKKINSRKTPEKLQILELKTPQPEPKPEPKPLTTDSTGATAPSSAPADPPCPHSDFVDAWNGLGLPFPKIQVWSEDRKKALRARWKEPYFREHWRQALAAMARSPWHRAEHANNKTWIADPEFFLRPKSVPKLIEGQNVARQPKHGETRPVQRRGDISVSTQPLPYPKSEVPY